MERLKLSYKNWRIGYKLISCFLLIVLAGCSEKDYVLQALDYEEQGDYGKAIAYWDKAIGKNPQNALYYISRGADKEELKDYKGAIVDYDLAIGIDSLLICGYMNRAGSKYVLSDYVGALNDYNTALEIYLFRTEHLQIKFVPLPGRLPFGNGTITNDNLIDEPQYNMDDILIYRGQVYYQMDSLNLALTDFTHCIDRQFCLPFCYYWRACIFYKMKNIDKAYDDLEQVLLYADKDSDIAKQVQETLDKGIHVLNTTLKY